MSIAAISNSVLFARTQQAYTSMGMDDEADGSEVAVLKSNDHSSEDESPGGEEAGAVGSTIDVHA